MSTPTVDSAANVLTDPSAYADEPRLHAALTHLRAHAPVAWVDKAPYRPFWAITKHADIMEIERANTLWINEPRPLLATAAAADRSATSCGTKYLPSGGMTWRVQTTTPGILQAVWGLPPPASRWAYPA